MTYIAQSLAVHRQRPSLARRIVQSYDVWRQRQDLRHLDDRALEDIGISRAHAEAESRRPAWDVPSYWLS